MGYLRLDSRHFTAGLATAGRALQATGRDTARLGSQASALTATVTATAVKFGALAGAANLVGGSLAVLGGGLVTASGALVLLPGAALAGATALGVLQLGLSGFGDALSTMDDPAAFAESIAKLAPAAQETAVAVRDLKPAWDELRGAVQQELFSGTSDIVRELGAAYLPILRTGMVDVAGSFGVAKASVAGFLREAQTMRDVEAFLDSTSLATANLGGALGPLLFAFRDIGVVGASVFAEMTRGAAGAAQRFADFIAQARESGQLAGWITSGLQAVRDLGAVLANVGGIIAAVFSAASAAGVSSLSVLVEATGAAREFLRSAEGMGVLQQIFGGLAAAGSGLRPVLVELGRALTGSIAPAVAEVGPLVGQAVAALAGAVGPLGQVFAAVAPVVALLAKILAEQLATAIQFLAPYVVRLAEYLAEHPGLLTAIATAAGIAAVALGPLGGVLMGLGSALTMAARLAGPVSALVGGVGGLGRALAVLTGPVGIVLGLLTALYLGNEQFRNSINTLLGVLGNLIGQFVGVLSPVLSVAAGLLSAVANAIAPLIEKLALGLVPIVQKVTEILSVLITEASPLIDLVGNLLAGAIGSAGERLAGLVSTFEPLINILTSVAMPILGSLLDTVTAVFRNGIVPIIEGAISVVSGVIETALALIQGDWSGAWEGIKKILSGAWDMIKGAVRAGIELVLGIFRDLPGALLDLLKNAPGWLYEAGKNIVLGLLEGLASLAGAIWDAIVGMVEDAWNGVLDFFGIGSPSKLAREAGINIGRGLVIGVDKMGDKVNRAMLDMVTMPPIPKVVIPAPRVAAPSGMDWASNLASATPQPGVAEPVAAEPAQALTPVGAERGALVHIEHYHPPADATPGQVATDLDWLMRAGGR